ncbi:MAG: hypothetical protein KH196_11240 [Oscillospiraceae bacterium]|nr:hypothetical protein [Oscillospiraceae bacterium]
MFNFILITPFLILDFLKKQCAQMGKKGPRQCSRGPSKSAKESRFYLQMGALLQGTAKTAPLDRRMTAIFQNITMRLLSE